MLGKNSKGDVYDKVEYPWPSFFWKVDIVLHMNALNGVGMFWYTKKVVSLCKKSAVFNLIFIFSEIIDGFDTDWSWCIFSFFALAVV